MATIKLNVKELAALKSRQQAHAAENSNGAGGFDYQIVGTVADYLKTAGAETVKLTKNRSGLNMFSDDGSYIGTLAFSDNLKGMIASGAVVGDQIGTLAVQRLVDEDGQVFFLASAPQSIGFSVEAVVAAAAKWSEKKKAVGMTAEEAAILF